MGCVTGRRRQCPRHALLLLLQLPLSAATTNIIGYSLSLSVVSPSLSDCCTGSPVRRQTPVYELLTEIQQQRVELYSLMLYRMQSVPPADRTRNEKSISYFVNAYTIIVQKCMYDR